MPTQRCSSATLSVVLSSEGCGTLKSEIPDHSRSTLATRPSQWVNKTSRSVLLGLPKRLLLTHVIGTQKPMVTLNEKAVLSEIERLGSGLITKIVPAP